VAAASRFSVRSSSREWVVEDASIGSILVCTSLVLLWWGIYPVRVV
jgi:hypothetical protein